MKKHENVLEYWFGSADPPSELYRTRWFAGGLETDTEISERFADLHSELSGGFPQNWPQTGEAILAAIIVIDQFSRNLYRGSAKAFGWDHLSLSWALEGWGNDRFTGLTACQQAFSLLPLIHSESIDHHDLVIPRLEKLSSGADQDSILTGFLSSAQEHRVIIQQFGRYPHRNAILNRTSTAAELEYLNAGGNRFGQ